MNDGEKLGSNISDKAADTISGTFNILMKELGKKIGAIIGPALLIIILSVVGAIGVLAIGASIYEGLSTWYNGELVTVDYENCDAQDMLTYVRAGLVDKYIDDAVITKEEFEHLLKQVIDANTQAKEDTITTERVISYQSYEKSLVSSKQIGSLHYFRYSPAPDSGIWYDLYIEQRAVEEMPDVSAYPHVELVSTEPIMEENYEWSWVTHDGEGTEFEKKEITLSNQEIEAEMCVDWQLVYAIYCMYMYTNVDNFQYLTVTDENGNEVLYRDKYGQLVVISTSQRGNILNELVSDEIENAQNTTVDTTEAVIGLNYEWTGAGDALVADGIYYNKDITSNYMAVVGLGSYLAEGTAVPDGLCRKFGLVYDSAGNYYACTKAMKQLTIDGNYNDNQGILNLINSSVDEFQIANFYDNYIYGEGYQGDEEDWKYLEDEVLGSLGIAYERDGTLVLSADATIDKNNAGDYVNVNLKYQLIDEIINTVKIDFEYAYDVTEFWQSDYYTYEEAMSVPHIEVYKDMYTDWNDCRPGVRDGVDYKDITVKYAVPMSLVAYAEGAYVSKYYTLNETGTAIEKYHVSVNMDMLEQLLQIFVEDCDFEWLMDLVEQLPGGQKVAERYRDYKAVSSSDLEIISKNCLVYFEGSYYPLKLGDIDTSELATEPRYKNGVYTELFKNLFVDFDFVDVELPVHDYYQTNYKDVKYGNGTISTSGCGPTCIAMITTYLTGSVESPIEVCNWCEADYYIPGAGTAWSVFPGAAEHYGYECFDMGLNYADVLAEIASGKPVVVSVGPGTFTSEGHYMVIRGMTSNGELILNDPNANNLNKYGTNKFPAVTVLGEAKNFWVFSN